MYLPAGKRLVLYTFGLIVIVEFILFTYNSSKSLTVSMFIPSIISSSEYRLSHVTFNQSHCDIIKTPSYRYVTNSIHRHELLNYLGFVVRSHSIFYCSVPKVATRTLLLFLTYLHIRDDVLPLLRNHSKANVLNIPSFNQTILPLIKKDSQITSSDTISLLHLLLSQLEHYNSSKIDLWLLYQNRVFPFIRPRSLSNPLTLFSPNYLRVIFVRHPFERLASAYIDKITSLKHQPFSLYDGHRRAICRKYSSFYLTEEQEKAYKTHGNLERHIHEPCKNVIPIFEHFIEYLIFTSLKDDVHWKPYSSLCQVCSLNYNFIGKFETIDEDLKRLMKYLGLKSTDWIKENYFQSGKTKENYRIMFSNLSDKYICYLQQFYNDDFKFFHYRIEDYLLHNRTFQCSKKQF